MVDPWALNAAAPEGAAIWTVSLLPVNFLTMLIMVLRMNDFPVPTLPMTVALIGLYEGSLLRYLRTISTALYTMDFCLSEFVQRHTCLHFVA